MYAEETKEKAEKQRYRFVLVRITGAALVDILIAIGVDIIVMNHNLRLLNLSLRLLNLSHLPAALRTDHRVFVDGLSTKLAEFGFPHLPSAVGAGDGLRRDRGSAELAIFVSHRMRSSLSLRWIKI